MVIFQKFGSSFLFITRHCGERCLKLGKSISCVDHCLREKSFSTELLPSERGKFLGLLSCMVFLKLLFEFGREISFRVKATIGQGVRLWKYWFFGCWFCFVVFSFNRREIL